MGQAGGTVPWQYSCFCSIQRTRLTLAPLPKNRKKPKKSAIGPAPQHQAAGASSQRPLAPTGFSFRAFQRACSRCSCASIFLELRGSPRHAGVPARSRRRRLGRKPRCGSLSSTLGDFRLLQARGLACPIALSRRPRSICMNRHSPRLTTTATGGGLRGRNPGGLVVEPAPR